MSMRQEGLVVGGKQYNNSGVNKNFELERRSQVNGSDERQRVPNLPNNAIHEAMEGGGGEPPERANVSPPTRNKGKKTWGVLTTVPEIDLEKGVVRNTVNNNQRNSSGALGVKRGCLNRNHHKGGRLGGRRRMTTGK